MFSKWLCGSLAIIWRLKRDLNKHILTVLQLPVKLKNVTVSLTQTPTYFSAYNYQAIILIRALRCKETQQHKVPQSAFLTEERERSDKSNQRADEDADRKKRIQKN